MRNLLPKLSPAARRPLAALTLGAGFSLAAAVAISGVFAGRNAEDLALGEIIDSPGKVVLAERVVGMRDGMAEAGFRNGAIDARVTRIEAERDPEISAALRPVYDAAYEGGVEGRWSPEALLGYLDAIEADRRDLGEGVRGAAALFHDLDRNDAAIFQALNEAVAATRNVEGPAGSAALRTLFMTEVAHDEIRWAVSQVIGAPAFGPAADRSLEGFLHATGVTPSIREGADAGVFPADPFETAENAETDSGLRF
ncbi:hypothetical protein [Defluviimonas salinarum]|uniref:Uncharacterized protein n=1 Tax=Defluviimonas salinarum TaxID=2992147 RepID=A0ABT3J884_9RHOB|nr:hypothetical protein [Defluviimonas salinarum]MCW3783887.1 hypothetical protein [Defluviimonas salinarum]